MKTADVLDAIFHLHQLAPRPSHHRAAVEKTLLSGFTFAIPVPTPSGTREHGTAAFEERRKRTLPVSGDQAPGTGTYRLALETGGEVLVVIDAAAKPRQVREIAAQLRDLADHLQALAPNPAQAVSRSGYSAGHSL